jgi:hypothetical protein
LSSAPGDHRRIYPAEETVSLVVKKQGFQGEKLTDEINNILKS